MNVLCRTRKCTMPCATFEFTVIDSGRVGTRTGNSRGRDAIAAEEWQAAKRPSSALSLRASTPPILISIPFGRVWPLDSSGS